MAPLTQLLDELQVPTAVLYGWETWFLILREEQGWGGGGYLDWTWSNRKLEENE